MEQEQLRGRSALSASSALSVSLQGGKKLFWFYWFNVGMCVFNIFISEIEKKKVLKD